LSASAITPRQIRAARALVGWSQDDLAKAARPPLSRSHIADIENEKANPSREVMESIRAALEENRVEFVPQEGVRIRHPVISEDDAPYANRRLLDDIFLVTSQHKLQGGTNEILIFGLRAEKDAQDSVGDDYLTAHLQRLKEAGLQEKILCGPDASNFIAPRSSYRRLAKVDPSQNPVHIYGNRVAIIHWRPKEFVQTIESEPFASALRSMFNLLWELHGGID
jgi:transcriptional regulator with XRE-family HTH domain